MYVPPNSAHRSLFLLSNTYEPYTFGSARYLVSIKWMVDSILTLRRAGWTVAALLLVIVSSMFYDFKASLGKGENIDIKSTVAFKERKKHLPWLGDGGIIFFLHVPKGTASGLRVSLQYYP